MDQLSATDPRLVRSRRDLFRLNRINRSADLLADLLRQAAGETPPKIFTDLGSSDGLVCLDVARRLSSVWPNVTVRLLDVRPLVSAETRDEFARLGCYIIFLPRGCARCFKRWLRMRTRLQPLNPIAAGCNCCSVAASGCSVAVRYRATTARPACAAVFVITKFPRFGRTGSAGN
jgi:hypothetical protein